MSRYKYHTIIKELVADGHYTADDIYDMIKKKGQNVSLATIYRTLEYIVGIDEFTTFSLDGSKLYYEKNKGSHAHLIDRKRNVIIDVVLPIEKMGFPAGFRPDNSVVNFFGSREGDAPSEGFNLLQFISIDNEDGQEESSQVPSTKNADSSVDIISAKKIFREF